MKARERRRGAPCRGARDGAHRAASSNDAQIALDRRAPLADAHVMRSTLDGFPDYSFYPTARLLTAFAGAPSRLRQALAGLGEDELGARARGADTWSIHEIVLHTADSELQGTFRIRKVWSEPGSALPAFDQDRWAQALDYPRRGREAREGALALLALLREQTGPLLLGATPRDWAKSGTQPKFGTVTLRNLLELYADHGERHLEQILECRRRLGRPLVIQPLLPRRLY
jgi:uncharacterized damage-inducible protein DinB